MSYSLGEHQGQAFICCDRCGMRSFNRNDIAHAYCAQCHVFHHERGVLEAAEALLALIPDRPWPGPAGPALAALRVAVSRARAPRLS